MTDRRCPYCGELIPEFSINCPKCYRDVPRKEKARPVEDGRAPSIHSVNRRAVALLALIPGAIGLMGLGHIYQKDYRKGLMFLCVGVILMFALVVTMTGIAPTALGALSVVMTVFLVLMFIGTYLVQAFDAIVRSLFRF